MSSPYCGWDKNLENNSDGSDFDFLQISNTDKCCANNQTNNSDRGISKEEQNNNSIS